MYAEGSCPIASTTPRQEHRRQQPRRDVDQTKLDDSELGGKRWRPGGLREQRVATTLTSSLDPVISLFHHTSLEES